MNRAMVGEAQGENGRPARWSCIVPPPATLVAAVVATIGSACAPASARSGDAAATSSEQQAIPKPYLLIEGWLDREYVSDLYAFALDGKLIRRLTSEPLPTCGLAAIAPGGGEIFFVANASAFYGLSLRHNSLGSLHSANVRTPAVSRRGDAIAFVIRADAWSGAMPAVPPGAGEPPLALRVLPGTTGSRRPTQFLLPAGVVPAEMTFAPDGEHVLITDWVRYGNARVVLADLTTGEIRPVLSDSGISYYNPVFAPDGRSLLAVREDHDDGRWSIVSLAWPAATASERGARAPTVVLTGPRGVSLSTPIFIADGKHLLFHHGDALARATLDGKTIESLSGSLDLKDRDWHPGIRHLINRALPTRPGWFPTVVTRYFARVEWHDRPDATATPTADVIIIDVQTKARRVVPIRASNFRAAVVVE